MIWSFYNPHTGEISSRKFSGPDKAVAANTPEGLIAIKGEFDPMSTRIIDGLPVDWVPPQPSDQHEWDDDKRRWVLTLQASKRSASIQNAMDEISRFESMQLRSIRELALDPGNVTSREKLEWLDEQIALARNTIRQNQQ